MKRIAVIVTALALSAGTSFAASASPSPDMHHSAATHLKDHRHHALHRNVRAVRMSPAADRETRALNLLESRGYGSFTDFQPAGKDYTAQATRNGHVTKLRIDPSAGKVTVES